MMGGISEREAIFWDMFPNEWLCPYCANELQKVESIPRDAILSHIKAQHNDACSSDTTWEQLYNRMSAIGGL